MRTLRCLLEFQNNEDREEVLSLNRRFSAAERYAYQRLLEGREREELKKPVAERFQLNTRYADDAILKASNILQSCLERGQNPSNVVFGGRNLFEQLEKKHLNGKGREKLEREWRERNSLPPPFLGKTGSLG